MATTRTVRRIALALATVVSPFAAIAPDAGAQTVGQLRVGPNAKLGTDENPARQPQGPGLAVDPGDLRHVVEVHIEARAEQCLYHVSFDGGATWAGGVLRAPADFPARACRRADAPGTPTQQDFHMVANGSVQFGSGQNVYTTFASQRPGEGDSVLVARSTDGGRTFNTAVVAIPGGASNATGPRHKLPTLAVRPNPAGDVVYVTASALGASRSAGDTVVARSSDGGLTWGPAVSVNAAAETRTLEQSQPVILPDGTVFVAYRTEGLNAVVMVARSTDGGSTWTRTQAAAVRAYGPDAAGSNFTDSNFPRMAADPRNGNLYLTWGEGPPPPVRSDHFIHPDADVRFIRSTDRGATWSSPVRVNDDPLGTGEPGAGIAQRHPNVYVAPDGRVDLVWHDRRHAYRAPTNTHLGAIEARLGDTYYAYSLDGGLTFSKNRRITDRSINNDIGLDHQFATYWDFGPVAVPLGNDRILFAWMDSREGSFQTDAQDIYVSTLDLRAGGPVPVQRLGEAGRAGLSAAVGRHAYQGGTEAVLASTFVTRSASRVVLVNEADPAAALMGAVLSRAELAPLLATPGSALPPDVAAEVARMQPHGVVLVGDQVALGAGVVNSLGAAGIAADKVTRLAGTSPADTARAVAVAMDRRTEAARAADVPAFDAVVVVNPATREAAAAAGLAAARRLPILFVDANGVPAATTDALRALDVTSTLVVGGSSAVSDGVLGALPGARRLGGGDPYAVSRAVVAESVARGLPPNIVYVADGEQPFDAALLGSAAGRTSGLLLLVPGADAAAAEQALDGLGLRNGVDRLIVARSVGLTGGPGYRLVARDGGVFAFGGAAFRGSMGGTRLNQPVVGMATSPSNQGYFLVAADGGVFAFGDARYRGSTGNLRLAQPVVGMAVTPSGNGYWLVARDGGVFAFGDARFLGSTGGQRLAQPVVGMARTPSGNGYYLVAADGGVFAFGDARFSGSMGATRINQPVVGVAVSPVGAGYWMVARDGGVFAFGSARFVGSAGGVRLNQPVVGMAASASEAGYHLVASDGGVFTFGDAVFAGSTGGIRLNQPVVAMSAGT